MEQIQIFKQQAARWLNTQAADLLGDSMAGKLLRPIISEMIDNYSNSPAVDAFLGIFVDADGKFNIDHLLDKYIDVFTEEGGIKFHWADIHPIGKMLDKVNGDRLNIITADDIKELKNAFLAETNKTTSEV